jgi:hypothetical protein
VVDSKRGRVPEDGQHRGVLALEAVELALLDPLDLLGPERRALRRLLDRQLPLQAQRGQRRGPRGRVGG